jgi:glyoxylase-like metal-dependent hydrolase (beta-lactamase superfamily II)
MRLLLLLLALCWPVTALAANSFQTVKLEPGVYAFIAGGGSQATSNAMLVVGDQFSVVIGAHMTKEVINDLVAATATVTTAPIRYFVVTHHHKGYSHIDFDFPPGKEVLMSWQTWQSLDAETRRVDFPAIFFSQGMTLKLGTKTLILTNIGPGHSEGDVVAYLPEDNVLFTSDLFYAGAVGYMGEGHMQEWVLALEFLEELQAKYIIPGQGPVSNADDLNNYKIFFKDFLTEMISHLEKGESLKQTLRSFKLEHAKDRQGYQQFMQTNIKRAYEQLQPTISPKR